MNNTDIYEMVEILMEMPKEDYFRCKRDLLNDKLYKSHDSTKFLAQLFVLIEKNRPELVENTGGEF